MTPPRKKNEILETTLLGRSCKKKFFGVEKKVLIIFNVFKSVEDCENPASNKKKKKQKKKKKKKNEGCSITNALSYKGRDSLLSYTQ